ncbi:AI-2E family transporter [Defluviimonas sp. D31]|uniref:AI-2E family transporter n=1 Tax=Defluviimonas sp. D31 TaxID=3083253 RepID=UPI00296EC583|nr:AI-2E family transporter [Defluviimonas sp. D31]MDW4547909.1 AI-2E family transporter [Defluviimonas sp. D31]
MKNAPLLNLVLAVLLVIMVGWLLVVGRAILLPIVAAVISVYVMVSATEALRRLPVVGRLPLVALRFAVLAGFTAVVLAIAVVFSATVREILVVAPLYEANVDTLLNRLADRFNLESHVLWEQIEAVTIGQIDVQKLALGMLGGFTSLGAAFFLAVVYAAFLLGERGGFDRKIAAAFPGDARTESIRRLVSRINEQIRDYITVKTLINIVLAMVSYVILWALGIDFALFWAMLIGILNYVPYVGSYIAVTFPVLLSMAQYGDIGRTALLTVLLVAVQVYVGNFLEPRLIGRQLNLSPFVVLVSLSIWAALWGIPGAILAVPMTSILTIVLAGFDATRPLAILLADRIETPTGRRAG